MEHSPEPDDPVCARVSSVKICPFLLPIQNNVNTSTIKAIVSAISLATSYPAQLRATTFVLE